MDAAQLNHLVEFLAPALPLLTKAGETAVQETTKKITAETLEVAKALWEKLRSGVAARPAAQEAVSDLAGNPEDEDVRAAFRVQLRKLLEENRALAAEVAGMLERDAVQRVVAEGGSAVADVSQQAVKTARSLQEVTARDRSRIGGVKQQVDAEE
jgi:hypothetical protein